MLFFKVQDTKVNVLLDSSGGSLHRRGYRSQLHQAPVNEVLAAGLLLLAGWNGSGNLIDPMCGSGTIAVGKTTNARRVIQPTGQVIEVEVRKDEIVLASEMEVTHEDG